MIYIILRGREISIVIPVPYRISDSTFGKPLFYHMNVVPDVTTKLVWNPNVLFVNVRTVIAIAYARIIAFVFALN